MKLWSEWLMWYNLWYPLKNIWKWRKSIWHTRSWDYSSIYWLLRDQLSYVEESIRLYSYHLNKENDCRDIKICLHLLDRLIEDDYMISKEDFHYIDGWNPITCKITPKYFLPKGGINKITNGIQKHDQELLFKILKCKMNRWWH